MLKSHNVNIVRSDMTGATIFVLIKILFDTFAKNAEVFLVKNGLYLYRSGKNGKLQFFSNPDLKTKSLRAIYNTIDKYRINSIYDFISDVSSMDKLIIFSPELAIYVYDSQIDITIVSSNINIFNIEQLKDNQYLVKKVMSNAEFICDTIDDILECINDQIL